MFSKRLNAQAEAAIAKSLKLEGQEDPQKEIDRQKKKTDDLEAARRRTGRCFARSAGPESHSRMPALRNEMGMWGGELPG